MQIETQRLIIRPWTLADVPHYQAMAVDIGYNCFSPPGNFLVKDEAEAQKKVKERIKFYEDHKLGRFLVFEKKTRVFAGTCGGEFFELDGKKEVEIGYRMMLSSWGKGYATESARALAQYFFNDLKLKAVYGFALPQNPQSIKVLAKVGFRYQKEFMWFGLPHKLCSLTPNP